MHFPDFWNLHPCNNCWVEIRTLVFISNGVWVTQYFQMVLRMRTTPPQGSWLFCEIAGKIWSNKSKSRQFLAKLTAETSWYFARNSYWKCHKMYYFQDQNTFLAKISLSSCASTKVYSKIQSTGWAEILEYICTDCIPSPSPTPLFWLSFFYT